MNPDKKEKKFGDYPIMEWADPRIVNLILSPEKSFEQMVDEAKKIGIEDLNKSLKKGFSSSTQFFLVGAQTRSPRLRRSTDLTEFYRNTYIQDNLENFKEFKKFSEFDASCDYEMFETFYD